MARVFFCIFHASSFQLNFFFRPEVPFNKSIGIVDTKNYIPEQTSLKAVRVGIS